MSYLLQTSVTHQSKIYSLRQPCIIEHRWSDFTRFAELNNLREVIIPGDGYCFPNAVRKCMMHDFYKFYTKDQLEKTVCDHLQQNFGQYTAYHNYNHEELIKEVKQFFNEGNFNQDIVDLFVYATGNALDIQLNIFRGSQAGNILELFQGNTNSSRAINLKLSGSGHYTGGNH